MRPQFNLNPVRITHSAPNASKLRELGVGTMCVALSLPLWPSMPALFEVFIICALLGLCYLQQRRVFYLGLIFGLIFFTHHITSWQGNTALFQSSSPWVLSGVIKEVNSINNGTKLIISVLSPKIISQQRVQLIDTQSEVAYRHGQHWLFAVTLKPVDTYWQTDNPYHKRLFGLQVSGTGWVQSRLLQSEEASLRGQLFDELRRLNVANYSWLPALLIGIKPINSELSTTLKTAGIIHLFVISGLHFAVVVAGLYWFILRLYGACDVGLSAQQKRVVICLSLLLAGFVYVQIVGAHGPAQRAYIAMCIGLLLRLWYVRVRYSDILLWVFLSLVISEPFCVVLPSVYLTFGALLCIGLCAHWLPVSTDTLRQKIQAFCAFQIVFTVLFTPIQFHMLGYVHPFTWFWNLVFIPIITAVFVPLGIGLLLIMYLNTFINGALDPILQPLLFIMDTGLEALIGMLGAVLSEPLHGVISFSVVLAVWLLVIIGASLPLFWWWRCTFVLVGLGLVIFGLTL